MQYFPWKSVYLLDDCNILDIHGSVLFQIYCYSSISCCFIIHTYIHTYKHISKYHLLSYIILFVSIFSGMTTWHWKTHRCALQRMKTSSPSPVFSVANNPLSRVEGSLVFLQPV